MSSDVLWSLSLELLVQVYNTLGDRKERMRAVSRMPCLNTSLETEVFGICWNTQLIAPFQENLDSSLWVHAPTREEITKTRSHRQMAKESGLLGIG